MPLTPQQAERRKALVLRLVAERKRARLTQEKLAERANLDRSFYVAVEKGHHSLSVERLFAIADALGTSPADLLAGIR